MKASEARKITDEVGRKVDMAPIYKEIEARALVGHSNYTIDVQKWKHNSAVDSVKSTLENDGYKVSRNKGYDQRDGDSWDQLCISW